MDIWQAGVKDQVTITLIQPELHIQGETPSLKEILRQDNPLVFIH
jgi:hypothetical protein